jgi:hypothetical protein
MICQTTDGRKNTSDARVNSRWVLVNVTRDLLAARKEGSPPVSGGRILTVGLCANWNEVMELLMNLSTETTGVQASL